MEDFQKANGKVSSESEFYENSFIKFKKMVRFQLILRN